MEAMNTIEIVETIARTTIKDVREFLETHPNETFRSRNAECCPLAKYLTDKCNTEIGVTWLEDSDKVIICDDHDTHVSNAPLSNLMRQFDTAFDEYDEIPSSKILNTLEVFKDEGQTTK